MIHILSPIQLFINVGELSRKTVGITKYAPRVKEFVEAQIKDNKIVVFSKATCGYCRMAKDALDSVGASGYAVVELDSRDDGDSIQDYLLKLTGGRTVPRVFIDGKFIGGGGETKALAESGELKKLVNS